MPGNEPPNMIQAGCYAAALHYLKALTAIGALTRRRTAPPSARR